MAHGKSLILAKIQPKLRPSVHTPNPNRRADKKGAKEAQISVRRYKRRERKAARLARAE